MSSTDPKLNPQEKELALEIFAAERSRVKAVVPHPAHKTAVEYYDKRIKKLQDKLEPRYSHYA